MSTDEYSSNDIQHMHFVFTTQILSDGVATLINQTKQQEIQREILWKTESQLEVSAFVFVTYSFGLWTLNNLNVY